MLAFCAERNTAIEGMFEIFNLSFSTCRSAVRLKLLCLAPISQATFKSFGVIDEIFPVTSGVEDN